MGKGPPIPAPLRDQIPPAAPAALRLAFRQDAPRIAALGAHTPTSARTPPAPPIPPATAQSSRAAGNPRKGARHGERSRPVLSPFPLSPAGNGPDALQPAGPRRHHRTPHESGRPVGGAAALHAPAGLGRGVRQGLCPGGAVASPAAPLVHGVPLGTPLRTSLLHGRPQRRAALAPGGGRGAMPHPPAGQPLADRVGRDRAVLSG